MIQKLGLRFTKPLTPLKKVDKIVVHHPAHPTWNIFDIHDYHQRKKGWIGIGYNYGVTKDGKAQEGRGKHQGAHCLGWNDKSLGICFLGDFTVQKPTEEQYKAGAKLIAQLVREHGLRVVDVVPHSALDSTQCPGKNFDMPHLKALIALELNPPKQTVSKNFVVELGAYENETLAKSWVEKLSAAGFKGATIRRK